MGRKKLAEETERLEIKLPKELMDEINHYCFIMNESKSEFVRKSCIMNIKFDKIIFEKFLDEVNDYIDDELEDVEYQIDTLKNMLKEIKSKESLKDGNEMIKKLNIKKIEYERLLINKEFNKKIIREAVEESQIDFENAYINAIEAYNAGKKDYEKYRRKKYGVEEKFINPIYEIFSKILNDTGEYQTLNISDILKFRREIISDVTFEKILEKLDSKEII